MKTARKQKGFTLIELMIVVAIVGVVTALSVQSYSGIAELNAPQNAAYDLSAAFSKARARATERNSNVWIIIWPAADKGGAEGPGAWAMFEDETGTFNLSTAANPGDLATSADLSRRLIDVNFLSAYPKANAKFGIPASGSLARENLNIDDKTATNVATKSDLLADAALADGCAFCDGSGATGRGAIVFSPDGEARFVSSDGTVSYASAAGRVMMTDKSALKRAFFFSISRPTSYVSFFSN